MSDSDPNKPVAPSLELHLPERLFLSGKPVPEETKPFSAGNGVGATGSTTENGPLEKCRSLLTVSDKARAEDWRDGIQTQLVVVSKLCLLSEDELTFPLLVILTVRRHDGIHHRISEETEGRPVGNVCRPARTAHQRDQPYGGAAKHRQQALFIAILSRRSRQRVLVHQSRTEPRNRHDWSAVSAVDSRAQQARRNS